jgi:hypothetical protein
VVAPFQYASSVHAQLAIGEMQLINPLLCSLNDRVQYDMKVLMLIYTFPMTVEGHHHCYLSAQSIPTRPLLSIPQIYRVDTRLLRRFVASNATTSPRSKASLKP